MSYQKTEHLDSCDVSDVDNIYVFLAKKYNLDVNIIKAVVAHPFIEIRKIIKQLEHPSIFIHNLGTFDSYHSVINKYIKQLITAWKNGKIKKEKLDRDIKKLWEFRHKAMITSRDKFLKNYIWEGKQK